MARSKQWLFVAPALLVVTGGGWKLFNAEPTRAASRITSPQHAAMESKVGRYIYAPTWLPNGGHSGAGIRKGRHRILQDFSDQNDRSMAILAQEPRSKERDAYHGERFEKACDAQADINGKAGFFVNGTSGERRLFWNEKDTALILSSTCLTDDDMVRVARAVR